MLYLIFRWNPAVLTRMVLKAWAVNSSFMETEVSESTYTRHTHINKKSIFNIVSIKHEKQQIPFTTPCLSLCWREWYFSLKGTLMASGLGKAFTKISATFRKKINVLLATSVSSFSFQFFKHFTSKHKCLLNNLLIFNQATRILRGFSFSPFYYKVFDKLCIFKV